MTTPAPDALRRLNQRRIDALRDQVITRSENLREDAADERGHHREDAPEVDYRRDDDEQLHEDADFHSGLGY